ncbi:MAG: thioredoxin domain-containing protein [bacterium]
MNRLLRAIFFIFIISLVVPAAALPEKTTPPKIQFINKLKNELKEKKKVLLYFYSENLEQSKIHMDRIKKVAEKEKCGLLLVNASAREMDEFAHDYKVMYVPAIVQLEYRRGITGFFHGKEQTTQFFKQKNKPENEKKLKKFFDRIEAVASKEKITILEFYAPWCQVCDRIAPVIREAETNSSGQMVILRVDMDETMLPAALYGIDAPPENVVLDSDGVLRGRFRLVSDTDEVLRYLKETDF